MVVGGANRQGAKGVPKYSPVRNRRGGNSWGGVGKSLKLKSRGLQLTGGGLVKCPCNASSNIQK